MNGLSTLTSRCSTAVACRSCVPRAHHACARAWNARRPAHWHQPLAGGVVRVEHCRKLRGCCRRGDSLTTRAEAGARPAAFPAGRKQAKVQLPACFISVDVRDAKAAGDTIGAAISAGVTGVLLTDDQNAGGAELYEAAVGLKELIRGRAVLLVANRTDIVDAVEADGVALTSKGVPTLVARRMMSDKASLVARIVATADEARTAAAEGANLVILESKGGEVSAQTVTRAKTQQDSSGSIPVVVALGLSEAARKAAVAGADGALLMSTSASPAQVRDALDAFQRRKDMEPGTDDERRKAEGEGPSHLLDASKEELLEAEREFLSRSLAFLQEAAPEMEEVSLVRDAIKQLDELFLLVVVGEFNSGKSSVINALLGGRFLAEGILPTTNEISVLKFSETGDEEAVQDADGLFVRRLPAELLRDINIVDTPGTNVIVDRQQRLTEEYVPRADLVLFCMSADRPFTESETNFLKYIRQWGKKVVFMVNKVDILANGNEVDEVVRFVRNSASRVLGIESTQVLPISARTALEAKVAAGGGQMAGGILSRGNEESLARNPSWEASRFGVLEAFILDYLVGGNSVGEAVRLKLQSPLYVADALLDAARQQLEDDLTTAEQDVAAVRTVQEQLEAFQREMTRDGEAQRSECRKLVAAAVKRAENLVDSTLQLSNIDTLSGYIFGSGSDARSLPVSRSFQNEVVGDSSEQLQRFVEDHSTWLRSNCERQLANYRRFAESRAEQLGTSLEQLLRGEQQVLPDADDDAEARRSWRESREAAALTESQAQRDAEHSGTPETALAVVGAFQPSAGALVLEEEIREAVIGTAGTALGAGVLSVILTFVLPNSLEDLLAIAVGGLIGYAALLNLPLRRTEAKEKLRRVATNFVEELEQRMEAELMASVGSCIIGVNDFVLPLQRRTEEIVAQVQAFQARQAVLLEDLQALQQRVANVE